MEIVRLGRDDPHYPAALSLYLADRTPASVAARGNLDILDGKTIALFCSVACPGILILQMYDVARALRDAGVAVIGGFHSPMEQDALTLLLRGTQPLVVCPARAIEEMRLPAVWQAALGQERLLLLSPFEPAQRRATAERAQQRNRVVAALATTVFVAHATPGGSTEALCHDVLAWGKPLLTLESDYNAGLISRGAQHVRPENIAQHRLHGTSTIY
jgi:predicted Rossmann fold nucleotide-binding protein DprA/Smf involved in DNA uptake